LNLLTQSRDQELAAELLASALPRHATLCRRHRRVHRKTLRHRARRQGDFSPVIREPITGGPGQTSGNFTLEAASSMAMLLRADSLPVYLALADQQILQPGAQP
jgi:preprotein translocase subunit SecD